MRSLRATVPRPFLRNTFAEEHWNVTRLLWSYMSLLPGSIGVQGRFLLWPFWGLLQGVLQLIEWFSLYCKMELRHQYSKTQWNYMYIYLSLVNTRQHFEWFKHCAFCVDITNDDFKKTKMSIELKWYPSVCYWPRYLEPRAI